MLCLIAILLVIVIIILIAMAVAGTKKTIVIEKKNASKPVSEEPDRRGPTCGRAIPFDAKLCPYCGKNFK